MNGWVLIRSWHIKSGLISRGGMVHTLCGKWAPSDAQQSPGLINGKSCETCFRLREKAD